MFTSFPGFHSKTLIRTAVSNDHPKDAPPFIKEPTQNSKLKAKLNSKFKAPTQNHEKISPTKKHNKTSGFKLNYEDWSDFFYSDENKAGLVCTCVGLCFLGGDPTTVFN